jgi:N6-L-threonylcarbamoyladenine synthase
MGIFLGIDTSNYTTSCALYNSDSGEIRSCKKLLPVKKGEKGLRQSDAVFHHIKQMPQLMSELFSSPAEPSGIAYSYAPRCVEGSYMPCFLVGESVAQSVSAVSGTEIFKTSHQVGHILAALYSCGRLDFLKGDKPFLGFHVSGGTTDLLLCSPDSENILKVQEVGTSLDLKAGQCVDRVGVMLGLDFPCGVQLEKLACKSEKEYKIKPTLKDTNCCLSGVENKCAKMISAGEAPENTARFCLDYIYHTVRAMTSVALEKYGSMPVVFAGGVMSDRLIGDRLKSEFDGYFATPELSSDNAVGIAVYAAAKKGLI